ncbi:unnamed protein product [Symbiodinium sp. CCMP2456]|nr:unnamed protein product [Symbiodinium sp. CCMP2456]
MFTAFHCPCASGPQEGLALRGAGDMWRHHVWVRSPVCGRRMWSSSKAQSQLASAAHGQWAHLLRNLHEHPCHQTYTAGMEAFRKSLHWEWCIWLVADMHIRGIRMPSAYGSAAAACSRRAQWQAVLALMDTMQGPNLKVASAAISACGGAQQWQAAVYLIHSMEIQLLVPDTIAWNAAITACKKGSQWQGAVALLPMMEAQQLRPTLVTFAALVEACGHALFWDRALALLEESSRNMQPDIVLLNAVAAAVARGAQWQAALAIYADTHRYFKPDIIMVNTILAALAQTWRWEESLSMLYSTRKPDSISYNTAMSACFRGSRWQSVFELYARMLERKLNALDGTFNTLCRVFENNSSWQSCLQILEDASLAGTPLSQLTLSVVVSACQKSTKWHQVLQVLGMMEASGTVLDDVFQAAGMTSHVHMGDLATALAWYRERPLRGLRLGGRKAGAGWLEPGRRWGYLDLHGLQPEEARLAVCCALLDATMVKPGMLPSWGLVLVTGRGSHSEGESVLRPAVLQLLLELGLAARVDPYNEGRVILPARELLNFICTVEKRRSGAC